MIIRQACTPAARSAVGLVATVGLLTAVGGLTVAHADSIAPAADARPLARDLAPAPNAGDGLAEPIPGEFVVAIETDDVPADLMAAIGLAGADLQGGLGAVTTETLLQWNRRGGDRLTTVILLRGIRGEVLPEEVAAAPAVVWTEPHMRAVGDPRELVPNDPQYGDQYHHPLMQNDDAWDITLGDASIIVAVADDGVQTTHPDLAPNIWTNPGEIAGNGLDDDANGYVDDFEGWDCLNDNNDPNPNSNNNDHGTHVAGIAAARTDNGTGVSGTAGGSTIMPVQFYTAGESWTAANVSEAFRYATDNGARIINMSYNLNAWVGNKTVEAAFDYLYDADVLHFNSAGNGNQFNPPRQIFHQTFLVANTTSSDQRSSSSNYGVGVDLAAPGSSVLSTVTNSGYGFKSGTSMAAPNACGVAALVWSANPGWTRDQVAAQVLGTTDNIDAANPGFEGLLGTGRVNAFRALTETLPAPSLVSSTGLPSSSEFAGSISEIRLRYDSILDPATVNGPNGFRFVEAGPDGVLDTADDVIQTVTPNEYLIAGNEIVLPITPAITESGVYRFVADASVVRDPFGTAIDGDGDGTEGGDFVVEFQICDISTVWTDAAEDGVGWSVQNVALEDGAWEQMPEVPVGGGDRGDPPTDFDGTGKCWLTDNEDDNSDVDGGPTRLISPSFDAAATPDPIVRFARWFDGGASTFSTEISNNGGATWVLVSQVTGGGGWESVVFDVNDYVTPTADLRLRFSVTDNPNQSVSEAGIDALEVVAADCDPGGSPDINGDGVVNVSDLLAVLAGWGVCPAGPCPGDVNGDGQVGVADLLSVLSAWT